MPMNSIKGSIKIQDVQTSNYKSTDATRMVNQAEVNQPTILPAMKSTGSNDDGARKEDAAYVDERRIKSAVDHVNSQMKHTKTRCEFSYHETTNRVSIKVIDKDTEEIIREIPPEETLEMVEKMWELAGLLVDERR